MPHVIKTIQNVWAFKKLWPFINKEDTTCQNNLFKHEKENTLYELCSMYLSMISKKELSFTGTVYNNMGESSRFQKSLTEEI